MRSIIFISSSILFFSACVTIAPPPPMVTFGGPSTTAKSTSEVGVAIGTGVALFDGAHAGAQGYFIRYKRGLSDQFDLGVDWAGATRNDGLFVSGKIAARYQMTKNQRLELGFGAADDSDGKSLNVDFAYTIGTTKDRTWNYYSSLRFGYAHGYPGNAVFSDQTPLEQDTLVPPNTIFTIINVGAQAEINKNQKFIFEGGYGRIFPSGEKSGPAFFVSAGLLFNIRDKNEE